jgi:YgiT-type zinc finger domain-containing protein
MNNPQRTGTATSTVCPYCDGQCEYQVITLTLRRSPVMFAVIRNVPADVCQTCGEAQFTVPTTMRLLSALRAESTPAEVTLTPIYDLAGEA